MPSTRVDGAVAPRVLLAQHRIVMPRSSRASRVSAATHGDRPRARPAPRKPRTRAETGTNAVTDDGWFTTTGWRSDDTAILEAAGNDSRAALQAGLRGTLTLVVDPATTALEASIAVPVRGDGDDLAGLFADLVEDLFAQLHDVGATLHDISLDGVLRRDEGGYRAWGYATAGSPATRFTGKPPALVEANVLTDSVRGVLLRATLRRT
jgi:hypothetical protein